MAVTWTVAIFLESDQNHMPGPDGIPNFDKMAHFGAYGLLATLWLRVLAGRYGISWRTACLALGLASCYGATDEFHQSFRPGRSVELADWIADTTGAAVAVGVYCLWPAYRNVMELRLVRRRRERVSSAPPTSLVPEQQR